MKDFFGFEIFDSGIGTYFFVCGLIQVGIFLGTQKNLKILGSADCVVRVISCNPFWKFLRLGNSAWDFLWVDFWSRDFFGFDFCPHSIIPVTRNPEYPPPPGG